MEERIINPHNFEAGHGPKAGSPPRSCSFSEVLPLFYRQGQGLSFSEISGSLHRHMSPHDAPPPPRLAGPSQRSSRSSRHSESPRLGCGCARLLQKQAEEAKKFTTPEASAMVQALEEPAHISSLLQLCKPTQGTNTDCNTDSHLKSPCNKQSKFCKQQQRVRSSCCRH